jgi:hypothetical protein
MVKKAELEKLKIDVVEELHEIRRKHAEVSSGEIEKAAAEIMEQIRARWKN